MVNSGHSQITPARPGLAAGSRTLETVVGRVLFWGGLVSILILLTGFGLHLLTGAGLRQPDLVGEVTGDTALAAANPPSGVFVSVAQVIQGLRRRPPDPLAIIALGLLVLLATPVLAVALAAPVFAAIGDYRYLVISLIILAILAAGFIGA